MRFLVHAIVMVLHPTAHHSLAHPQGVPSPYNRDVPTSNGASLSCIHAIVMYLHPVGKKIPAEGGLVPSAGRIGRIYPPRVFSQKHEGWKSRSWLM